MDSLFRTPHQEAEHLPPALSLVVDREDPEILDEDPEILACWIAVQQINGVEARILELRQINEETRTDDLRAAIDGAIEDCEQRRLELVAFLSESVSLLPLAL
jgi:hypothetical protein